MTDAQRILKGLECCGSKEHCHFGEDGCPFFFPENPDDCTSRLARAALALLNKQEAIEPHLDVDEWKCGKCGHDLEHQEMLGDNVLFHELYNYCPNCGKAVKWND